MNPFISLTGAILFVGSASLAAESIDFNQIESRLREKSPVLALHQEQFEAKVAREGYLLRSFLPELSAEVAQETFKLGSDEEKSQPTWKLEASLNVFRGGVDAFEDQSRKLESQSTRLNGEAALQDELREAYRLYWQLSYKQEVLAALQNHLELSQKNLKEANRRINSGVATSTDRLEFEMKQSLIRQEIALNEKDVRVLSKELGILLGSTDALMPTKGENHFHDWEKTLQVIPAENLPQVQKAQAEKSLLEARRSHYRGEYFPAVDLIAGQAQLNQREERDFADEAERKESYVGVRASWSLGKTVDAAVERGSLARAAGAKEKELRYLTERINLQQQSQMDELKTLHSFVHDSEENIQSASRYLDSTLKEYARGVKNSLDVMAATEKLISAKIRFAEITRDFNILYSGQLALKARDLR